MVPVQTQRESACDTDARFRLATPSASASSAARASKVRAFKSSKSAAAKTASSRKAASKLRAARKAASSKKAAASLSKKAATSSRGAAHSSSIKAASASRAAHSASQAALKAAYSASKATSKSARASELAKSRSAATSVKQAKASSAAAAATSASASKAKASALASKERLAAAAKATSKTATAAKVAATSSKKGTVLAATSSKSGGGLIGFTSSNCGASQATSSDPNGSESFLNCGLSKSSPSSGWTPPKGITISMLKTVSIEDALAANSVWAPCKPYIALFEKWGAATNLPPIMLAAIALQESTCNPSDSGDNGSAVGLMQIVDKCAGLDKKACAEPSFNIGVGAKYLANQLEYYGGDVLLALGSYNGWYAGLTYNGATAAASGGCCDCQQNLDYLYQMLNGWLLGKTGYEMGSIGNLDVCGE